MNFDALLAGTTATADALARPEARADKFPSGFERALCSRFREEHPDESGGAAIRSLENSFYDVKSDYCYTCMIVVAHGHCRR